MYIRDKKRTERMINRYFESWYRIIPPDSHPFNGIVKLNSRFSCCPNFNFTFNKKYYVINGYILDNKGYAYGVYPNLKKTMNNGFSKEYPAYPIESFDGLENNLFEIIEEF